MHTDHIFPRTLPRRAFLAGLAVAGLGLCCPARLMAATGQELAASGQSLLAEGHVAQAVAVLKEAAKAEPANAWVWNLLGRAYMRLHDALQAQQSFRSALRSDPADGYARMMLDLLAQHPPAQGGAQAARPGAKKRLSSLEEQARQERRDFMDKGAKPDIGRVIVLDPGHGGTDPGATGPGGLVEKDVTLDLARLIAETVRQQGKASVYLTRDADYNVPLWARAATADLYQADVFMSLHCTAAPKGGLGVGVFSFDQSAQDELAQGVAALENGVTRFERAPAPARLALDAPDYLTLRQGPGRAKDSRDFAARLAENLKPQAPLDTVRAMGAPLRVLEGLRQAAVLVEAGYLSNPAGEEALRKPETRRSLAEALARALTA